MRGVIAVLLVACGSAPPPAAAPVVVAPAPPPATSAITEKPVAQAVPVRRELSREETILFRRRGFGRPHEAPSKRSDLWDPCVRDVLQGRDVAVRNAIGDALTGYVITCDRETGTIYFSPPHGPNAHAPTTVVGIGGEIGAERTAVVLSVVYVATRPDPFERVTIIAGAQRWTSPNLDVDHEQTFETAAIPFSSSVSRIVRCMLDEEDARVRFETATGYDELLVTAQMKTDMRVMLDALNL